MFGTRSRTLPGSEMKSGKIQEDEKALLFRAFEDYQQVFLYSLYPHYDSPDFPV